MILLLSLLNACSYIDRFTRFAGELFGMLIAVRWRRRRVVLFKCACSLGKVCMLIAVRGRWLVVCPAACVLTALHQRLVMHDLPSRTAGAVMHGGRPPYRCRLACPTQPHNALA